MSQERKYREEEIAEIFEAASARSGSGAGALQPAEGLTLAELQAIGSEVGMTRESVAEAAAALDLRREALRGSDFGMPVSVRRTVDLPRAPTEREWEMLVAELRETFDAKGRVSSRGEVREWTNGNLHAYVEPTAAGYRLRLRTTKGDAVGLNRMGAAGMVMALVAVLFLFLSGELPESLFVPMLIAAMGGGALAFNALRLPGWAEEREAQMERVAASARLLLGAGPEDAGGGLREGEAG